MHLAIHLNVCARDMMAVHRYSLVWLCNDIRLEHDDAMDTFYEGSPSVIGGLVM